MAADELVKRGELKEILPGWSALGPLVQLVYPKSLDSSLVMRSFIEFALESIPKYLIPDAGSPASPQESWIGRRRPAPTLNPLVSLRTLASHSARFAHRPQ
jgi:hypothetical protein